jgi:hypothetical protein
MTTSPQAWVPAACTLPTVEQPLRVAEFDDLFTAVRGTERVATTTLRLNLDPSSLDFARDLAARETECCSFFDFRLRRDDDGGVLWLDVRVPAGREPILDAIARLASTHAPRAAR